MKLEMFSATMGPGVCSTSLVYVQYSDNAERATNVEKKIS